LTPKEDTNSATQPVTHIKAFSGMINSAVLKAGNYEVGKGTVYADKSKLENMNTFLKNNGVEWQLPTDGVKILTIQQKKSEDTKEPKYWFALATQLGLSYKE
jgi:hypothetical protein